MERVVWFIHKNFKLILVLISVVIIAGVFFIGDNIGSNSVSASTAHQKYFVCIEIQEGDSLWSIADLYLTEEYSSVDEYVDEVKSLNNLDDDKIFCGATLVVPYYAP